MSVKCSLRRNSEEENGPQRKDDPNGSRPDAQGVQPKTGMLGARFANASIEGGSLKLLLNAKPITLPDLVNQKCRFSDMSRDKRFSWNFTSAESFLKDQELDVDLSTGSLPKEGAKFKLSGSMNSAGSVTFRAVEQNMESFGLWTTNGFNASSQCDLSIDKLIT